MRALQEEDTNAEPFSDTNEDRYQIVESALKNKPFVDSECSDLCKCACICYIVDNVFQCLGYKLQSISFLFRIKKQQEKNYVIVIQLLL